MASIVRRPLIPTTVPQVARRSMVQAIGAAGTLTATERYGLRAASPSGTPFSGNPTGAGSSATTQPVAALAPANAQVQQVQADQFARQQLDFQRLIQGQQDQLNSLLQGFGDHQAPPAPPGGGGDWQPNGDYVNQWKSWEQKFRNGYINQNQLVNVHGMYVSPVIAQNLNALLSAAQKAGVWNGRDAWATGTYRNIQTQNRLWYEHTHDRYGNVVPPERSMHPAAVAKPGTSLHGWGLAIDFNNSNSALIRWLSANASRYGLYNLPGEAWHYSVNGH